MEERDGIAMDEKEVKVKELFVKMLEDATKYAVEYEFYEKDMKDFHEVVQWKFGPIRGYQIFQEGQVRVSAQIGNPPVFYRKDSKFTELFSKLKEI